jgi:hypothetical protein
MIIESEKILKEWQNEMNNFCDCFDFGKSFMNNQAIKFMNRNFDTTRLIDLGILLGRQEVEREHAKNFKLIKEEMKKKFDFELKNKAVSYETYLKIKEIVGEEK